MALIKILKGNFKFQGFWLLKGGREMVKSFYLFRLLCILKHSWISASQKCLDFRGFLSAWLCSAPGLDKGLPPVLNSLSQAPLAHRAQLRCCLCRAISRGHEDAQQGFNPSPGRCVCSAPLSCLQMLLQHIVIKCHGISTQPCAIIAFTVAYNSSLACHQLGRKQ